MSIVERALKKTQAAHRGVGQRSGDAAAAAAARGADRAQQAAAIDPAVRIQPVAVAVDPETCRERRLLISNAAGEHDRAAVAAYRMLRTRLLHRARSKNWSTIAVTSAGPNDGKTLTVLNLALSMAREKSRDIVLLDMDMRNPSVCRMLDVHAPHEMRDFLEHGERVNEIFFSIGSENLLIAGGMTPAEHASELLAGPRFNELVQVVKRGTVDPMVLIDLPPVLVTDDALVVAPKVDAVLVVASEGLTNRAELAKALDLLSEFPIVGVVLNRAAETTPDYNYGYDAEENAASGAKRN